MSDITKPELGSPEAEKSAIPDSHQKIDLGKRNMGKKMLIWAAAAPAIVVLAKPQNSSACHSNGKDNIGCSP